MPSTKKIKKVHILKFTRIKGNKQGKLSQNSWNQQKTQFKHQEQIATEIPNSKQYKIAVVDPETKNIIQWRDVSLMQVGFVGAEQQATGETTQQAWNMQYKKKLAQQFGTSKSKRKINQMLSNTITS